MRAIFIALTLLGAHASGTPAVRWISEGKSDLSLRDALEEIAGERGGKFNSRILGHWIERHKETRCAGVEMLPGTLGTLLSNSSQCA